MSDDCRCIPTSRAIAPLSHGRISLDLFVEAFARRAAPSIANVPRDVIYVAVAELLEEPLPSRGHVDAVLLEPRSNRPADAGRDLFAKHAGCGCIRLRVAHRLQGRRRIERRIP